MDYWKIIGLLVTVLLLVATKWWDTISEHVGYPFNVRRIVRNLDDAVKRLSEIQHELHRHDPYPASERRKGWVQSKEDLDIKVGKIKAGDGLNYFSKLYLAKEELKKAIDLVGTGKELLKEARERPSASRDAQPQHPHNQLTGMASYEHKVRNFIDDKNHTQCPLLGIWGMGGVGKTCLLEFARNSCAPYGPPSDEARPGNQLDHILFVRVGRGGSVGKTQKAIAASMGLPVMPDETSQEAIIYNHLKDKSFLLLIDDLWEYLDLKAVGIPMPLGTVVVHLDGGVAQQYQRKVVLTTRSEDVCGKMGCARNTIRLECLSKDDAWNLFVDKAGEDIIKDTRIYKLARKLVDECGGLPRALCTMGQSMSTKKDPREWRNAIDLLKESRLREINMNDELFDSLKHSYDNIDNDLKDCFLICSLWPRDGNIPKEKLVEWWAGLGLFDVSNSTDRAYSNINCLRKVTIAFTLRKKTHIKMHEVNRKMALWIVNDQGEKNRWLPLSFCRSAMPEKKWSTVQKAWVSVAELSIWSSSITCPELTMLVSRHAFSFKESPCFQNITFLDLEGTKWDTFPLKICVLEKLQYLNLSATIIDALPLELQKLSNLSYLYIRDTRALQTIPKELISQLAKLRMLDLFCSGSISSKDSYFSSLIEGFLESKSMDLILGITVHAKADIMKLIQLKRVVHTQALCMDYFKDESHPQSIALELLSNIEKLRELTITQSQDIQELVAEGQPGYGYELLPYLEFFELSNLHNLQKVIWKNTGLSIRVLVIYNCTKLRHVSWVHYLLSLEELTIAGCSKLEKVIDSAELPQEMEPNLVKSFCKLKRLYLEQLPNLSDIYDQSLVFEELLYVYLFRCENLKVIRVQQCINRYKVMIDCDEDWWTSLGENQERMNLYFVPTFCFQQNRV
ncbi:hypothetical protein U9M48_016412 [Paspalum notatum var. saurae]|uniref:NB-ARC domain-containing protein n=1 Tax=Paspalum notatum var. saurae TaxID=547442 RepID=A0AAQ3WMT1_PASNO